MPGVAWAAYLFTTYYVGGRVCTRLDWHLSSRIVFWLASPILVPLILLMKIILLYRIPSD